LQAPKTPRKKSESKVMPVEIYLELWSSKMKVEDLVGTRVWMKSDQFRSFAGVISSVPAPVDLEDLDSAIAKSMFKVDLPSGEVIQVEGSNIVKIDHERYDQQRTA
jgi:hypothetical protein